MKLVVALSCLLIHMSQCGKVSRRSVLGESCTTPFNHPGECRNIDNCQLLLDMRKELDGERSADASAVLIDSRCGSTGVDPPLYCCPHLPPTTTTPSKCGSGGPIDRVTGGGPAELGAWPWIAALGYLVNSSLVWKCAGTLVTDSHVLTAAHCIDDTLYKVRLGDLNLDDGVEDRAFPVDMDVEPNSLLHPEYKADPLVNDIAVIKMKGRVNITDLVHPICLPNATTPFGSLVGENPYVVGWGRLRSDGPKSNALQQANVPVTSNDRCRTLYRGYRATIDEKVICAGNIKMGTCEGDSGGPLMYAPSMYDGLFFLVGVVSYGKECSEGDLPTVYMNVSYYMDWIHEKLN